MPAPVRCEKTSLRVGTREHCADGGAPETLHDDIERLESSALFDDRAKAAPRYTDALIWSPAHLVANDVAEVRTRFSEAEAIELSLGADAPRVEHGTERYLIGADGRTVFS
jgi:hypothetical protein